MSERKSVILSDAERRNIRRKLKESVTTTKQVLAPRQQLKRLLARNKARARQIADGAAETARNNVPLIGALGLATLLISARRPISNWISNARERNDNAPEGEE
jgi:hypothetical protein